jgi:hypothetical protein
MIVTNDEIVVIKWRKISTLNLKKPYIAVDDVLAIVEGYRIEYH